MSGGRLGSRQAMNIKLAQGTAEKLDKKVWRLIF